MRRVSSTRWARSELVRSEPLGQTSNLAVILRDLERDEYRLLVIAPDGSTLCERKSLVVNRRMRSCCVAFDASALFWYDCDDLHALAIDGTWERAWPMGGEQIVRIFAPDAMRVLACREGIFPSIVAVDLENCMSRPLELPHKPVTQLAPMLEVDATWHRVAFGYVYANVMVWDTQAPTPRAWPFDETRMAVLTESPFIASMQFSQDASRLVVSSEPDRDGSPVSQARVGSITGEGVREFDTTALRKRITALPDLSVAFSTSWEASGQILALDLESGTIREVARVGFVPRDIVISRDGRTCYVIDKNGAASFALDY